MRSLQVATLALATAASTGSLWADSVDIFALNGGVGGNVASGAGGLTSNVYWGTVIYGAPAPPYHITGDPTFSDITTGPLIGTGNNEWLFDSGGSISIFAQYFVDFTPIPIGQSCEDVGLGPPDQTSGVFCSVAQPRDITGSFTGPVTLSIEPLLHSVDVTGPVAFDLGAGLAFAMGVSRGPYFGTFDAKFTFTDVDGALFNDPNAFLTNPFPTNLELTGTTVPEPSTFLLLATVAGIVLLASRRRNLA